MKNFCHKLLHLLTLIPFGLTSLAQSSQVATQQITSPSSSSSLSTQAMFTTIATSDEETKIQKASLVQKPQELASLSEYKKFIAAQSKAFEFTYMTFNTCESVEFHNDATLYQKYGWINRLPRIIKVIADEKPDIIGFQEIRNAKGVKAFIELSKALAPYDYELVHFKTNPSDRAAINVIAYNPKKLVLDNVQRWWASETPDRFSDSWGNGWGRLSLMATFYPITTQEIRKQQVVSPDYGFPAIHVVNVHRGLGHCEKIHSNLVDIEQIAKRVGSQNSIVFIGGDFNTFPDDCGPQEMQVLQKAGYVDILSLKTETGIPVSGTFVGYSYNKYKSKPGTLGNQLDHIMCQQFGTPTHALAYFSYVNPKKYRDHVEKSEAEAKEEADFLKSATSKEEDRDFPSDHLPGIAHIVLTKLPAQS